MNCKISGLKALVTGGGTRIGRAIALELGRQGCNVAVHYWKSKSGAEETVAELNKLGQNAVMLQADLRRSYSPKELSTAVLEVFGGLDILINNASVYSQADKIEADHDLLAETVEEWELSMSVNARSPFFLIKHLAPALQKSANGNVINILDTSISDPFLSRASHSISKSALAAISRLAHQSLSNVRVNSLELGHLLAPSGLVGDVAQKSKWVGVEPVLKALNEILSNKTLAGQTIKVG